MHYALCTNELSMKFAFYTLGCKVNQYETQAMEQLLTAQGHTLGAWEEACDGYIINTCSVTAVADKKNRNVIRRCRREHPHAIIAVCGCHSQHDPQTMEKLGVDLIGGSAHRAEFIHELLSLTQPPSDEGGGFTKGEDGGRENCQLSTVNSIDDALKRREFEILPPGGVSGRTRAMLKVQDGCSNFCSYCIIPYTRGPVRSAPVELAVQQAAQLAAEGYKELVVTGIEIASWGKDLPGKPTLETLLTALCQAVPQQRIRLGSLEPRVITEEFCQSIKKLPNLCHHFHLSMQSGSDAILAAMKRKYDTKRYYQSVELLNKHFPDCSITTDMIVAFPGETEEQFAESLAFIQKCGFADMHIFPYSRRSGTPADKMTGQHTNETKEKRSRQAIAVAEKMNLAYRQNLLGKQAKVLFEEEVKGLWTGHTPNYIKVYVKGQNLHNKEHTVNLTCLYADGIYGEIEN